MKNYTQTKQAKNEFKSDILAYMLIEPTRVYTKQELMARFGMSERTVRAELERIANYYPIRATASRKGYSIIWWDDSFSEQELENVANELCSQISEIQNRVDCLRARIKPLIANLEIVKGIIESSKKENKKSE